MKALALKIATATLVLSSASAHATFVGFGDALPKNQVEIGVDGFSSLSVNGVAIALNNQGRIINLDAARFADGVRHSFIGTFMAGAALDGKTASALYGEKGSSSGFDFTIKQVGSIATITGFFQGFEQGKTFAANGTVNPLNNKWNPGGLPSLGYGFGAEAAVAPVPEPETYALMGMGLVGLLAARRRKVNA